MSQEISIREQKLEQKRKDWKAHINTWQASGLSQGEYCRRHELKPHQFVYWRHRHTSTKPISPVSLVQVPMTTLARAIGQVSSPAALRVSLGRDLGIEVLPGFDGPTLQQVVKALREVQG